jgi:hypothetical protein
MAKDDDVKLEDWSEQGHQGHKPLDNEGNTDVAGNRRKFSQENEESGQMPLGGVSGGRGGSQGGQNERSGGGQQGNEKAGQQQLTDERGDTESKEPLTDEGYDRRDLMPGGSGKHGDQQQFSQEDREPRKDKSRDEGGSDHLHGP